LNTSSENWAAPTPQKIKMGFNFQVRVTHTLLKWGYLEGQISMRPPTPPNYRHRELLEEQGRTHYSSPDVTVINNWMHGSKLTWKFGLCCGFRSRLWHHEGRSYVTLPKYQAEEYKRIHDEKKLTLYWCFGYDDIDQTEIKFTPVEAPWEKVPISYKGGPPKIFAGYAWDDLLDERGFIIERLKKNDTEVRHMIAK